MYLYGTEVAVDVQKIMVCEDGRGPCIWITLSLKQGMGVKCIGVNGTQEKRFDSGCVQEALKGILAEVV